MARLPMELLAPAGSWDAMVAAVRCGADAVYLGVAGFNARRRAVSFSLDPAAEQSLAAAVGYCHARGVKVHAALNIVITEREFERALAAAKAAAQAGVDALIVQDRGLARAIHVMAPSLVLHASTQLTCHTPSGVDRLRKDGFSRVVLAREMTEREIAACAGRGCELEVFVHGALCMSVSGQCELSAMLGGRSGNRGLCAQPCRLPFAAGHAPVQETALSLKDQSLGEHLPALYAAGVTSLKIEGRMKRPEYVAAACAHFRRLLDGEGEDRQLAHDLQAVFSRHGFTDGYVADKRDGTMFGNRRYEDVTAADAGVLSRLARLYDKERPSVAVSFHLTVQADTPATLTVRDEIHTITAIGEIPQAALNRPLSADRAQEQLKKTGGTPFAVTAVTMEIADGLTLPAAALNALRRDALDQLIFARTAVAPLVFSNDPPPLTALRGLPRGLVARVASETQVCGNADWWVVPLGCTPSADNWGVEIPRGMFGRDDAIQDALIAAKNSGAAFALCGTVGAVELALKAGIPPVGGWSLHITNAQALSAAADNGVVGAVLSPELTFAQLRFAKGQAGTGLFAYGRQPLMLMRNCPVKAATGCASCGGSLTDRRKTTFPVMCAGGCSELLNSVPLYLADRQDDLHDFEFLYLHFTDETPERVAQVLDEYRVGGLPPAAFTRGLYDRGWNEESEKG